MIRIFYLERETDLSGVSGQGRVAVGIDLGFVAIIKWRRRGEIPGAIGIYQGVKHIEQVHGHCGATTIEFIPFARLHDRQQRASQDYDRRTHSGLG